MAIEKIVMAMLATDASPTRDQLRGMTGEQAIPVLTNLYSRILADIEESKRQLNQATFGPDTAPVNICDTPMCIAGHTVNMAGAEGYKLKDLFGFSAAARLIHFASRPDVAPPRYDSYANEWALAYIEARAAEEKKGG